MTIFLVIILALAAGLMMSDFSWTSPLSAERNDLVFENRNKEYGAFALRREHHKTIMWAMLFSFGVVGLASIAMMVRKGEVVLPKPPTTEVLLSTLIDIEMPIEKDDEEVLPETEEIQSTEPSGSTAEAEAITEPTVVSDRIVRSLPSQEFLINKTLGSNPTGLPGLRPTLGGLGVGNGPRDNGQEKKEIPSYAAIMPEFPGGAAALYAYMGRQVGYTEREREMGVEGTLYVTFVVATDGSISDVKVARGIPNGQNLENRVMEAIRKMPLWKPGQNGDTPVPVRYSMPVKFALAQ
jgi:periplasmic protein TonB